MSFHPEDGVRRHLPQVGARARGRRAAVRLHAGESRAVRRDRHALPARPAPVGGAAGAVSGPAPAGLHHGERDALRRRAARHHAQPTWKTSCRSTRCSITKPVGKFVLSVCRTLSCALNGAERVTEALAEKLGIRPGETDADRDVHAGRSGVPRRVRPRAGRDGQRRLARVPEPGGRVDAARRPAARGEAALTGCHHVVEKR